MKKLTEAKIKQIMEPLKTAEFIRRFRKCKTCDGTGYISYYEPDDGSEADL